MSENNSTEPKIGDVYKVREIHNTYTSPRTYTYFICYATNYVQNGKSMAFNVVSNDLRSEVISPYIASVDHFYEQSYFAPELIGNKTTNPEYFL